MILPRYTCIKRKDFELLDEIQVGRTNRHVAMRKCDGELYIVFDWYVSPSISSFDREDSFEDAIG